MKPFLSGFLSAVLAMTMAPALDYAVYGRNPVKAALGLRVAPAAAGPDTLVATVGWRLIPDNRGEVDSLRVIVPDLTRGGGLAVRLPATAVSAEVRQGIPFGDATYPVQAQVCAYRRGKAACATTNQVTVTVVDTPPALPDGLTLTTTVITP